MPTTHSTVTSLALTLGLPAALRWLHSLPVPMPLPAPHLPPAAALEALSLWGLRALALVVGWWVLGSGALYLGARLADRGAWTRRLRPLVLPVLRRAVDGAVAASLVTGAAHAAPLLPPGLAPPGPGAGADVPTVEAPAAPVAGTRGTDVGWHVVEPGDHLWSIAEATLARRADEDPALGDLPGYWARLVEANRDRLRSGDPDLIHPGERLALP